MYQVNVLYFSYTPGQLCIGIFQELYVHISLHIQHTLVEKQLLLLSFSCPLLPRMDCVNTVAERQKILFNKYTCIRSNVSAMSWREQVIFDEIMRCCVLDQYALLWYLQCQLTETTVCGQTCRHTRTNYHYSDPTSICSYSLMLHAQLEATNTNFIVIWFDATGARTHDLPHSRRTH